MRPTIKGIAVLFFLMISGACSEQGDATKIIEPEKMKVVLWDYLQIQHYAQEVLGKDPNVNDTFAFVNLRDSMFHRHHIDSRSFEKTMLYYRSHPDEFMPLLDSVLAFEKRIKKPERTPSRLNLDGVLNSLDVR